MSNRLSILASAALAALVIPFSLRADTEVVDGITWTYTVSGGEASVGGGSASSTAVPTSTSGAITIPATLGGYPVTSIGDAAFYNCTGLTSAKISDSVRSIGAEAFSGCSGLTSVTIPSSRTKIGSSVFCGCGAIRSVTIPGEERIPSVFPDAYQLITNAVIAEGSESIVNFQKCGSLQSVTIPESVSRMKEDAFRDCNNLASVHISDLKAWCGIVFSDDHTPTSYRSNPLSYAHHLFLNGVEVNDLVIPDDVASIGHDAFSGCSFLTSVRIPDSVASIGPGAFSGCDGLCDTTTIPGVSLVDGWVIGSEAGVSGNLRLIGCRGIGDEVFSGCNGLTSVLIPDSVKAVGFHAFLGCDALYDTTTVPGVRLVDGWAVGYEPTLSGAVDLSDCRGIANYAFWECSGLTSIQIPKVAARIGECTFDGCSGLTSVMIPDSVKSIECSAFVGCSGLASVTIGSGVKSIGTGAFWGCSSLTSVHISDLKAWCGISFAETLNDVANPLSKAQHLFLNGAEVTDLVIPDGVTHIRPWCFYKCSGLVSVTIPDNVKVIGDSAFSSCSSLASVSIGDGVETIGELAFYNCSSLVSPSIGSGVKNIGDYAFYVNGDLTETRIAISDIAEWATNSLNSRLAGLAGPRHLLMNGKEVTNLVIPGSVTSIGERAFYSFSGLESVTIPDSVTSIGFYAFSGCKGLKTLYLPKHFEGKTGSMGIPAGCEVIFGSEIPETTYSVIYVPGANGTGSQQTDTKTRDVALTLKGAIFTRTGYTQTGWSMSDGGPKTYGLSASYTANAAVTLYPFWSRPATVAIGPEDGPGALQTAIASANDGDTILVSPGTYSPIDVTGRRVDIRAAIDLIAPDAVPVIDGSNVARCATLGEGTILSGFILRNGRADFGGGALGGKLENCYIENCNADVDGGGLYECAAENTVIAYCEARGLGGGAYHATLTGCTVYGCTATTGAGVAGCQVANSIVWENRLYAVDKKGVHKLGNCANVTEGKKTLYKNTCTYTDSSPKPAGTGNLAKDPLFVDAASGDFRLQWSSPVKDKGKASLAAGDFDLGGLPRLIGAPDMGAYEIADGTPVPADYDGDGVTDAAYFDAATARWIVMQSRDGLLNVQFGDINGTPIPADYDGDGKADFATYLATAKVPMFHILTQLGEDSEIALGEKGATPFAADIDDDGIADPGVFQGNAKKPSFIVMLSSAESPGESALTRIFGTKGAKAVIGDFDGDGTPDFGCYTSTASKPVFKVALSGETWSDKAPLSVTLGAKGAEPCCGDFDGDGITDFAAYSGTAKAPLLYRMFSTAKWREVRTLPFGQKGSRAVTADWDGDGAADAAIEFRGQWWYVTLDWDAAPILAP